MLRGWPVASSVGLKERKATWFAGKSLSALESKFSSTVASGSTRLSFYSFKMDMLFLLWKVLGTARSVTALIAVMAVSARPCLVLSLLSSPCPPVPT